MKSLMRHESCTAFCMRGNNELKSVISTSDVLREKLLGSGSRGKRERATQREREGGREKEKEREERGG